jgi:hypothetical protein
MCLCGVCLIIHRNPPRGTTLSLILGILGSLRVEEELFDGDEALPFPPSRPLFSVATDDSEAVSLLSSDRRCASSRRCPWRMPLSIWPRPRRSRLVVEEEEEEVDFSAFLPREGPGRSALPMETLPLCPMRDMSLVLLEEVLELLFILVGLVFLIVDERGLMSIQLSINCD